MLNFNVGRTSLFLTIGRGDPLPLLWTVVSVSFAVDVRCGLSLSARIPFGVDPGSREEWPQKPQQEIIWCIFIVFVQGNTFDFQTEISWARQINGLASFHWISLTKVCKVVLYTFVISRSPPPPSRPRPPDLQLMRSLISRSRRTVVGNNTEQKNGPHSG